MVSHGKLTSDSELEVTLPAACEPATPCNLSRRRPPWSVAAQVVDSAMLRRRKEDSESSSLRKKMTQLHSLTLAATQA